MDSSAVRGIIAAVTLALCGLLWWYWRHIVARNTARIAPLTADRQSIVLHVQQPGPLGLAGRPVVTAPDAGFRVTGRFNGSVGMSAGVREGDILHSALADGRDYELLALPTQNIVNFMREELPRPLQLTVLRDLEQPYAFAAAGSTV